MDNGRFPRSRMTRQCLFISVKQAITVGSLVLFVGIKICESVLECSWLLVGLYRSEFEYGTPRTSRQTERKCLVPRANNGHKQQFHLSMITSPHLICDFNNIPTASRRRRRFSIGVNHIRPWIMARMPRENIALLRGCSTRIPTTASPDPGVNN